MSGGSFSDKDPENGGTINPMSVERFADELPGGSENSEPLPVCCGCCCDFRRAVIAVNTIMVSIGFIDMILVGIYGGGLIEMFMDNAIQQATAAGDEDAVKAMEEFENNNGIRMVESVVEIMMLVFTALYAAGLYGAYKFKQAGVLTALITYCIALVGMLITLNPIGIVMIGGFIYPHFMLYKQLKSKKMTASNYSGSCCGKPRA